MAASLIDIIASLDSIELQGACAQYEKNKTEKPLILQNFESECLRAVGNQVLAEDELTRSKIGLLLNIYSLEEKIALKLRKLLSVEDAELDGIVYDSEDISSSANLVSEEMKPDPQSVPYSTLRGRLAVIFRDRIEKKIHTYGADREKWTRFLPRVFTPDQDVTKSLDEQYAEIEPSILKNINLLCESVVNIVNNNGIQLEKKIRDITFQYEISEASIRATAEKFLYGEDGNDTLFLDVLEKIDFSKEDKMFFVQKSKAFILNSYVLMCFFYANEKMQKQIIEQSYVYTKIIAMSIGYIGAQIQSGKSKVELANSVIEKVTMELRSECSNCQGWWKEYVESKKRLEQEMKTLLKLFQDNSKYKLVLEQLQTVEKPSNKDNYYQYYIKLIGLLKNIQSNDSTKTEPGSNKGAKASSAIFSRLLSFGSDAEKMKKAAKILKDDPVVKEQIQRAETAINQIRALETESHEVAMKLLSVNENSPITAPTSVYSAPTSSGVGFGAYRAIASTPSSKAEPPKNTILAANAPAVVIPAGVEIGSFVSVYSAPAKITLGSQRSTFIGSPNPATGNDIAERDSFDTMSLSSLSSPQASTFFKTLPPSPLNPPQASSSSSPSSFQSLEASKDPEHDTAPSDSSKSMQK